ncbi:MAG: acetylxylan esterase [Lentisphaeria bacterium]|jgi:cephalosporin-C deacetylase|nr:acetylxylan esterase [Lentisphaeria bacterium]
MPLLFDMSRERLETYQGINPRPADFDAYWERGLAEMRALDPAVELVPAKFQVPFAECFDLFFTGVGGARIHAKLARPKQAVAPHPAVVQFHGYSGSSGDWLDKMPWAALGFTIAALDCRGQAGLSEDVGGVKGNTLRGQIIRGLDDAPERLLFRQIFLDCAQLAGLVMAMPEVDAGRVGCFGGSQGGGLTLACAALEPRIRRAAPNFPFLCDYQRVWEMDQAKDAYAELKEFFRSFDPLHEREKEIFTRLGYIDVQHLASRIQAEVMMAVGFCDTVCPPSTQFSAYNKIPGKKSYVAYPDFGHEGLPGHGDRVFQFLSKL